MSGTERNRSPLKRGAARTVRNLEATSSENRLEGQRMNLSGRSRCRGCEQVNPFSLFSHLKSRHRTGIEKRTQLHRELPQGTAPALFQTPVRSFYNRGWDLPLWPKFNCKGEIKWKEYMLKIMSIFWKVSSQAGLTYDHVFTLRSLSIKTKAGEYRQLRHVGTRISSFELRWGSDKSSTTHTHTHTLPSDHCPQALHLHRHLAS